MFDQNVLTGFYVRRTGGVIKYTYRVKPAYGEFLYNKTLFYQALFQYTDT